MPMDSDTDPVVALVEIWTDGGCRPNPGPGGWAALLRFGERERELSGGEKQTTNNRMELTAARRGAGGADPALHGGAAYRQRISPQRRHPLEHRLGAAQLAQRGGRPGRQHGSVAARAGRGEAAPGLVALGARPCRPCRERPRRPACHRGPDRGRAGSWLTTTAWRPDTRSPPMAATWWCGDDSGAAPIHTCRMMSGPGWSPN